MGRSLRLAVGAALGVIPFVVGQTAAGAAVASDSDSASPIWTPAGGGDRIPCFVDATHTVDTGTGGLDVQLDADCRGTIDIVVRYTDENGEAMTTSTSTRGSNFQSLSLHKVGRTAVTADYRLVIDGCVSACVHELHTSTK